MPDISGERKGKKTSFRLSKRDFLKLVGVAAVGALTGCVAPPQTTSVETKPAAIFTSSPELATPKPVKTPTEIPFTPEVATRTDLPPTIASTSTEEILPSVTPTSKETLNPLGTSLVFLESLKNEAEGITLWISDSARKLIEQAYFPEGFREFWVDPDALMDVREALIIESENYYEYQEISWNGSIAFLSPDGLTGVTSHSFPVEGNESHCWDTEKPLVLYAVTAEEIEQIKQEAEHKKLVNSFTQQSTSGGLLVLIYTDKLGTGDTYVYASVDHFVSDFYKQYWGSAKFPASLILVGVIFGSTIGGFWSTAFGITSDIGKKAGDSANSNWIYDSFGCDVVGYIEPCSAINYK